MGRLLSTARHLGWLTCLLAMITVIGLPAPASAEAESPDDTISNYLLICLDEGEKQVKRTESGGYYCCDGAACYVCNKELSACIIINDESSSSSAPAPKLEPLGLDIRQMQESPSEGQLQDVCTSVKANFTNLEGFGYSCVKPNCNGKGDYCSIICHGDRRCTAGTPDVLKGPVSLRGILQNGDNIDRSKSSSENESLGGGGGGNEDGGSPCGPYGCLELGSALTVTK